MTGNEPSEPHEHTYNGGLKRVPYKAKNEDGYEQVPNYVCHPDCVVAKLDRDYNGPKSHFFYQASWGVEIAIALQLEQSVPVFYSGKVGKDERELGCWDLPIGERKRLNDGGLSGEPRYQPTKRHNPHPTLKPISLTTYIARLFLPPEKYAPRRAIVPFCGTGREMAGCLLAGFDEVVGIELKPEYAECARATLREVEKWQKRGYLEITSIIEEAYKALALKRNGAEQLNLLDLIS